MTPLLKIITNFGDSAFLLPASAVLFAYLVSLRATRVARIWVIALTLCAVLTVGLKVVFLSCGAMLPDATHSPSGHTSLSTTFYGCAALMLTGDKGRGTQIAGLMLGNLVSLAVAISRVLLHAHTLSEVALGLVVGIICIGWFGSEYLRRPPLSLPWQPAVLAVGLLATVTHGTHWNFEWLVDRIAGLLRSSASICV